MSERLKTLISRYGFIAIMFLFTYLIIAAPEIPILSRVSDYMVHIMVGLLAAGLILLILNNDKLMLTSLAACAVLCVFLKNESNMALLRPSNNGSPSLSISHINLSNVSDEYDLISLLNETNSDILSFQELTPDWSFIIKKVLSHSYPYSTTLVRIDPYGKGVYSKFPILEIDTIVYNEIQDLSLKINNQGSIFQILSTYLIPALDQTSKSSCKVQVNSLIDQLQNNPNHRIVLGEYNMVYWASEIRRLRAQTGLLNSRRDIMPASLKVPYDHIFYTPDLVCLQIKDLVLGNGSRIGIEGRFQNRQNLAMKDIMKESIMQ